MIPRSRLRPAAATSIAAVLAVAFAIAFAGCGGGGGPSEPRSGAAIYAQTCATCHGVDGQGGVGPALKGVADRYPDIADQIAVVTNGFGRMPAFRGSLSAEEIRRVVEYERTELGA